MKPFFQIINSSRSRFENSGINFISECFCFSLFYGQSGIRISFILIPVIRNFSLVLYLCFQDGKPSVAAFLGDKESKAVLA